MRLRRGGAHQGAGRFVPERESGGGGGASLLPRSYCSHMTPLYVSTATPKKSMAALSALSTKRKAPTAPMAARKQRLRSALEAWRRGDAARDARVASRSTAAFGDVNVDVNG